MLRHLLLEPHIVLEVLKSLGCRIGPSSSDLCAVSHPASEGSYAIVSLAKPLEGEVIEAHLDNLGLTVAQFQAAFDRYRAPFTG